MAHPLMYIVPAFIAIGGAIIGMFIYNQNQQQAYDNYRPRPNNRTRRQSKSGSYFDEGNNCSICLEEIRESSRQYLGCGHCFHIICIRRWFLINRACPNCKTPQ